MTALAEATQARIPPVDSEHSALFQLLRGEGPGTAQRLILTASGGRCADAPTSRGHPRGGTGPSDLGHGRADTIDSATLMNKGLEVIEAHHLFGLFTSGSTWSCTRSRSSTRWSSSTTAPSSRTSACPTCGFRSPTRCTSPSAPTSRADARPRGGGRAHLRAAHDLDTFPCLRLARAAGAEGDGPCVLNAADEVAVTAFLDGGFRSRASAR